MNTVKLSVRLPERLRKRVKGQNLPRRRKVSRSLLSSEPTISPEKESGHDSRDEESGLVWRPVARSQLRSGFDDAAVLTFEEIDDVDIVYEELEGGRKRAKLAPKRGYDKDVQTEASPRAPKRRRIMKENTSNIDFLTDEFDGDALLPNWSFIPLLPTLKRQLHSASFTSPTDIQAKAIPLALSGKDIVGVAETGSGKTLAYGLPILQRVLNSRAEDEHGDQARKVKALILAPTRELAIQVSEHLRAITPSTTISDTGNNALPAVSVVAIVGGMSALKQKRLLDRGVDIIIATPGRLWDIIQENDTIAAQLRELQFLVLDEADRMIETGHFQELDNIVKLTLRPGSKDGDGAALVKDPEFAELERKAGLLLDDTSTNETMQTFVYSATLSKDLQRNLKKRSRLPGLLKKKGQQAPSTLDELLVRLDFRDPEVEVIDLSPEGGVVSTLLESKIECTSNDKDLYLYYFLLRYPGRSLVFVSSIDSIRRIIPLLENLQLPVYPLHSQLQQKQRLKNLDRFKSVPNAVLVATDVAARGLDIQAVDHVVHYQLPRTADVYVHRNGRTARAKRDGFSLQLVGPEEQKVARAVLQSLGRTEMVPNLSVGYDMLAKLKDRVTLARQIDAASHAVKKANHERNWLKETAEALEVELSDEDDEEMGSVGRGKRRGKNVATEDDGEGGVRRTRSKKTAKTASMRAELKAMLSRPLVARGISTRYLTSGSRPLVDDLLSASSHQNMLGVGTQGAHHDIVKGKKNVPSQGRRMSSAKL